jgi:hypothetical protein
MAQIDHVPHTPREKYHMKATFLTAAACLILTGPAHAMTDTECATLWKIADTNGDGKLTGTEGDRYLAMMRIANQTAGSDGALTETVFQESCKTDLFRIADADLGAPLAGANSFTETQAKDRVLAHGISMPASMVLDDKGIWRGSAMQDGRSVTVAVDYKGNVVAQ